MATEPRASTPCQPYRQANSSRWSSQEKTSLATSTPFPQTEAFEFDLSRSTEVLAGGGTAPGWTFAGGTSTVKARISRTKYMNGATKPSGTLVSDFEKSHAAGMTCVEYAARRSENHMSLGDSR